MFCFAGHARQLLPYRRLFVIPRSLVLRNFMCYRDELPPLDFQGIQIACLSGENGAGNAILDAMTGRCGARRA